MRDKTLILFLLCTVQSSVWAWGRSTLQFERILKKQGYKDVTCVTLVEQRNARLGTVYTGNLVRYREWDGGMIPPPGGANPTVYAMAGNKTRANKYIFRLFDQNNSHSTERELFVRESWPIFAKADTLTELHLSFPEATFPVDPDYLLIRLNPVPEGKSCPTQ